MNTSSRCAAAIILAIGVAAPLVIAQDRDQDHRRYYDKSHKDYHTWNDSEQKSYGVFLNENHLQVHVFAKAKPSEQQKYWAWRHDHPDEKR